MKKSTYITSFLLLHVLLAVYSCTNICSKLASAEAFLSLRFCLFYAIEIVLLGIYAVVWQQIIKKLPLTTAYANKAVTVLWGTVWGAALFHEHITWKHILGIVLIMAGVVLYSTEREVSGDEQ